MINKKLVGDRYGSRFEILNRMYEAGRKEFMKFTRMYGDYYVSDEERDQYVRDLKAIGIANVSVSIVFEACSMITDFKMIFPYATYMYVRFLLDKMKENPHSYGSVKDCRIDFREIMNVMGFIKNKSLIDNESYCEMHYFLGEAGLI